MVKSYEMLVGMERHEDAAAVASTLMKVDDSAATHLALAQAALRTGRPSEADAKFAHTAVGQAEPPEVSAVSTLVEILVHLGRRDDAVKVVEQFTPQLRDERDRKALAKLVGQ